MNLISTVDENFDVLPGELIQPYQRCKTSVPNKCRKFYESLFKDGPIDKFVCCPCGLSSIMRICNGERIIYTCFRERSTYRSGVFIKESKNIFNPVLDGCQILSIINMGEEINHAKTTYEMQKQSFDNILHEVKKLNGIIKEQCNTIFETYALDRDDVELSQDKVVALFGKIRTIYSSSNMIYSKYALYDFENEPDSIKKGKKCAMGVYKKFDKMRRILKNYRYSGVKISISGLSYKSIMMYESFDSIPLLILDNAVKYSPPGEDVHIEFKEGVDNIDVKISSLGPYVEDHDLSRVFERGFRGESAQQIDGNGIGLYFVKKICELHNIQISVQSDSKRRKDINGVIYAPFIVSLKVNDAFDNK